VGARARPQEKVAQSYVVDAYVCLGQQGTFRTAAGEYRSITLSYSGIAKRMGCSRSTAMRACHVLECIGALVKILRWRGRESVTSEYRLIFGRVAPPEPPTAGGSLQEPGGVPGEPGGSCRESNQEPSTKKFIDQEEGKLASAHEEKIKRPDRVDQALTAHGLDPAAARASVQAYLAEQGKGLGIVVVAHGDGTLPALIAAWRRWAEPVPMPPPASKAEGWLTLDVHAGLEQMADRLDAAQPFAGLFRPAVPPSPRTACDCAGGWLGDPDHPRPCPRCKPHARPVIEHAPEYVEVVPA